MSAQHAVGLVVHLTQRASYHQGQAHTYAEVMRLVRQTKQAASNLPMAEVIASLDRLATALYDEARSAEHKMAVDNRTLREIDATLSARS